LSQACELFIPLPFQIIHDQAVFRPSQQVLALGQLGLFTRTLHLGAPQTIDFSLSCPELFEHLQCHLQRSRIDRFQDEFRDSMIDLGAGQPLAYRLGGLDSASLANIVRDRMAMDGVISHRHA